MIHRYLRTVGLSQYQNREEFNAFLDQLQESCRQNVMLIRRKNGERLWEIHAALGPGIGIVLGGYVDSQGVMVRERYMPYIEEPDITSDVYCSIQRHVEGEEYSGLVDDTRVGIPIIFCLINGGEYMIRRYQELNTVPRAVCLTAFSKNGKILLPMQKNARQREMSKVADKAREKLIEAARHGDEAAMESLNSEDMMTFSAVSRRMMKEDIYSIVDSCFMPQGIECEIYQVIGDILTVNSRINLFTGEEIWDFLVQANDLPLHVVINQIDLQGEPRVGRRFKGTVWMQGTAVWDDRPPEESDNK